MKNLKLCICSYMTGVIITLCALAVPNLTVLRGDSEPALDKYQRALCRTVLVETEDGKGSGFIISGKDGKPYLWTAAHVTDGARRVKVTALVPVGSYLLSHTFDATVLAEFDNNGVDAAVAVVDAPVDLFVLSRFADHGAKLGDDIWHAGWFLGKFETLSWGRVDWIGDTYDGTDLLAQPGSSGGPIFNKSGEVVGVLIMMRGTFISNKQQLFTNLRSIRKAARAAGLGYAL